MTEESSSAQDVATSASPIAAEVERILRSRISIVLRCPEVLLHAVAGVVGIGLGLSASFLIRTHAPPGSNLARMFGQDIFHALIPVGICCMFFWAISICFFRSVRLFALYFASRKSLLQSVTNKVQIPGDAQQLFDEFNQPKYLSNPLIRRVKVVVEQWTIHPSLQNVDIVLQQHITSDTDLVHASYSLVKIFIWALPVLGLVGTVLGIAEAVGSFAQFLGGSVENVVEIKKSLVEVTRGLSFAFMITLQGLLTSLIAMLLASPLQTREEKLYATIQNNITDIFLPKLQRIFPESKERPTPELIVLWQDSLQQVITQMIQVVQASALRILTEMDTRHKEYLDRLNEEREYHRIRSQKVHTKMLLDMVNVGKRLLGKLDERLHAERDEINKWTQDLRDEIAAVLARQEGAFIVARENLGRASQGLVGSLSKVQETVAELTNRHRAQGDSTLQLYSKMGEIISQHSLSLRSILDMLHEQIPVIRKSLQDQLQAIDRSLERLAEANLGRQLESLVEAFSAQRQQMASTAEAVKELAGTTRETVALQLDLQASIRQLHDIGFERTLASFRDSLLALGPVLEGFRQPFVLQAVHVDRSIRTVGPEYQETSE